MSLKIKNVCLKGSFVMSRPKKEIDLTKLTKDEWLKYEVAAELGVFDKVMRLGWQSLTASQTGRIGGIVARKKKEDALKHGDLVHEEGFKAAKLRSVGKTDGCGFTGSTHG